MGSLFSMLSNMDKIVISLIIIAITFAISMIFTLLVSLKMRGTKSFFITSSLMPVIVAAVISMVSIFLNDTSSGAVRIATIAVALGLIRFRSVNGRAEELLLLFAGIAIGLISGLGYVVFAVIFALLVAILYLTLTSLKLFDGKRFTNEKLLKITIPESLEYDEAFDDIFAKFLKKNELVEVKTTGMGSMYRLSYRIELKDTKQDKAFIDELRIKNGNLEISILPYMSEEKTL